MEKVGIGLSPAFYLDVNSGTKDAVARFASSDRRAFIYFKDSISATNGSVGIGADGNDMELRAGANDWVHIKSTGSVGIGTKNPGSYRLAVNGKIRCKELVVDTGWADFVFEEGYRLPPLSEVEWHIQEKGHLPGIPTAAQVKEKGVSIGDISAKLLQKVEELTLYVIDLKKENDILKTQLVKLQDQLNKP